VVYWSEILATDPEARVRFPAQPEKKKVMGLERGPLSLVSTTEELLDRKVAAEVKNTWICTSTPPLRLFGVALKEVPATVFQFCVMKLVFLSDSLAVPTAQSIA
jgi:hypothetical protein